MLENVGAIRIALAKWIEAKGAGWHSNDRNAPPKRPISALFDLVQKLKARLPPEERAAVQHLIAQQQTLLYRNFQTARLALPGFNTASFAANAALHAANGAGAIVAPAAGAMNEVAGLLKDLKTVMDRAADVIQDAPFKLTGLPTRRATTHSTAGMVMHTLGWS